MSGLDWFPFYVNDWMSSHSVRAMTFEERGAHLHLMIEAWADGGTLPDDTELLARLLGVDAERLAGWLDGRLGKLWPTGGDGRRSNEKLLDVLAEQEAKTERRRAAGKRGGAATKAKVEQPSGNAKQSPGNASAIPAREEKRRGDKSRREPEGGASPPNAREHAPPQPPEAAPPASPPKPKRKRRTWDQRAEAHLASAPTELLAVWNRWLDHLGELPRKPTDSAIADHLRKAERVLEAQGLPAVERMFGDAISASATGIPAWALQKALEGFPDPRHASRNGHAPKSILDRIHSGELQPDDDMTGFPPTDPNDTNR